MNPTLLAATPQTGLLSRHPRFALARLHSAVQQMHATGKPLTRTGTFRVRQGTNVIANIYCCF